MPTAAKLIAAIIFAVAGYFAATSIKPFLPEGQPTPYLIPLSVIIPPICAWRVIGRLIGRGYNNAINTGIYGIVCAVFFTTLAFAIGEMIKRSTRKQYEGPMDAIVNMFGIFGEYALLLVNAQALTALGVGAVLSGILGEWAHRKWG